MSSYEESFKSKMNWGNVLERAAAVPLDRSSMFASYEDAVAYARGDGKDDRGFGATSYIGQIITVYENDTVRVFVINANRNLDEITSIVTTVDNAGDAIDKYSGEEGKTIFVSNTTYSYENESGETIYTTDASEVPEGAVVTEYVPGTYEISDGKLELVSASSTNTGSNSIIVSGGDCE